MIKANITIENKLIGWYNTSIHKTIPTPNIEVSKSNWKNAIENNHNKINDDGTTELFDFRTDEEIKSTLLHETIETIKSHFGNLIDEGFQYKEYWITCRRKDQGDLSNILKSFELFPLDNREYDCYSYINNIRGNEKEEFFFTDKEFKEIFRLGASLIRLKNKEHRDMLVSIRKLSIKKLENFKI
tara:strand:+ start:3556 stop:4110 length:555 start_codon:yes stop_codon:yes gene_type:complete